MSYFVISNSDGDTSIHSMSKDELLKDITPDKDGCTAFGGLVEFLDNLDETDTNYWGNKVLIIKGEIVVPEPEKLIATYNVE